MILRSVLFTISLLIANASLAAGLVYDDVKTIIDANCAGPCHNDNGAAFFFPFTGFAEIKGNEATMIQMIETDRMPQGEAAGFKTSIDGVKLLTWLKTGTDLHPGSAECPEEPAPHLLMKSPRDVRYEDVKPIIDRHCVGCHNPQGEMSRKPFTTLAGIRRHADDAWKMIDKGRMPRGNPAFRFTPDGRALMDWLRYGGDSGGLRSEGNGGGVVVEDDD